MRVTDETEAVRTRGNKRVRDETETGRTRGNGRLEVPALPHSQPRHTPLIQNQTHFEC